MGGPSAEEAGGLVPHRIVLRYASVDYELELDLFPDGDAKTNFMFTEGNYACDCNRSLFIQQKYPEFKKLLCSAFTPSIELISLEAIK